MRVGRQTSVNPHCGLTLGPPSTASFRYHQHRRAASGSDRAFDQGRHPEIREQLERAGVVVLPQDGSFLAPAHGPCGGLVVSTAVEDQVPDVAAGGSTKA